MNWKSGFQKNYKTIIASTLLAFLLWFMVKMNKVYDYTLDIPIHYVNVDADKIYKFPLAEQVRVEFTGKGLDLLRLRFYDLSYEIDLSGFPAVTKLDLSAHPEYVRFPGELKVAVKSVIRPRLLTIELDKKVQKKLPLKVVYHIETPPGFLLAGVYPRPDSVLVTGPAEMFRHVREIQTEKKKFKPVERPFTETFRIRQPERYYSELSPQKVAVLFDIQRLAERMIPEVPVVVVDVPKDMQVIPLPSSTTVYVKGGEKVLADLKPDDFKVVIDFRKEWRPGIEKVTATITTKAKVLYMETRPPDFELIVQKMKD